jgi:PAS domain S-box-containing protein
MPKPPKKQAIEQEKAIADALFLSIGEGAIVIDAEGRVNRVNQAALTILGFEREELLGKWYPAAVVAEDEAGRRLPYIERPIAEVFFTGKSVFRKMQFKRKDRTRVTVALTVSPVLLDGKPIGAIEIFRDITEEVRLNRAKDEFISLASHQLRTPATSVKQYLGMLLEGYAGKLSEAQRHFITTANHSNERQLRIIDDLLKVAVADAGTMVLKKGRVNLVPLIKTVIADQGSKFTAKNLRVSFIHQEPQVYAYVDKNAFRMVLENLIDNAQKYTYAGKSIEIAVTKNGQQVDISIKDQGTGIDRNDFEKLFQKFSRLNNPLSIASGGTGLGLYWVRQIVDLHGGNISVESEVGKGTTFILSVGATARANLSNKVAIKL